MKPSFVFAHGLAAAAAVPYGSMLVAFAASLAAAQGEERAMLKFVTLILGFLGYPLALLLCLAVFGPAFLAQRHSRRGGMWYYILWGVAGATALSFLVWIGGPRSPLGADAVADMLMVVAVGGTAGAAFRLGGARFGSTGPETSDTP